MRLTYPCRKFQTRTHRCCNPPPIGRASTRPIFGASRGIGVSDIFQALEAILGSYFINRFNIYGRVWQVILQARARDRNQVNDIYGSTSATTRTRWRRCARF
jgi:hypothetical protein